jgi:Bacterial Ig domain
MKVPFAISVTCGIFLGMLGCAGGTEKAHASLSPLPFGVLDNPHPGEVLRGKTLLRGWALSESGIQSVTIYVDRTAAGFATLGIGRPDVQRALANFPDAAEAGWELNFDTTRLKTGPHELVAQARSKLGATRDLGSISVTIAR